MPVSRQQSKPPPPPSEAPTQQVEEEVEEELHYVRADPDPNQNEEVVEIVEEEVVDVDEDAWRENIIVRFPKEQVEELVNYLIVQLLEQGYSEEEASEKAAEMLDDPASQLVMARELHKPVLVRALTSFYEQNDPSKLQFIEEQVNTYTGRTEELLQLLSKRYGGSSAGLDAVQSVVEEEREWIAVTERSTTAGASSRRSSNVHDSGRRFLTSFFRKYDATRVAEVDALLLMHEGDFGELRRSLCQDFASNNEALEMLLRMRVSNDECASGRESWLLANARCANRAREKRNSISHFIEAVGFSSSFHHFVTFWLISACAFTVLYGIQILTNLFLAMFLPTASNGTWQSIGLMCLFFLLTFFLGSYFTQFRRVLLGWAFMTEAAYFADKDFSLIGDNNPNPIPSHLKASLPPIVKRTILMLPTGSYIKREFYLGLMIVVMGLAPLFYALISVAANGETITHAIGEYVVWNLSCSTVLVTLVWAYGWCCATVRKWRVVRKQNSSSTPTPTPWYTNPQLLQEWGLDKSTLSINISLFIISFTVLCIVFWAYTRNSSSLSVTWTVVCLLVICSIQGLRELWRSDNSKYTPHATLFLIAVFCGVGIVGTAITSAKLAATFFVLLILSHGMTIKRNTETDETEDESCMARALERMNLATEEEIVDIDEATPLKVGKAKSMAIHRNPPSQGVEKKGSVWRMLPCSDFLRSLLAFPCYCWPIGMPVRDTFHRSWRPSKLYYPRVPKVLMSFSSLISVSFLLLFVISSVLMFSTAETMKGTLSRPSVGAAGTKRLPVCNLKWSNELNVVDMALLSQLSYHSDADEFADDLKNWFGDSLNLVDVFGPTDFGESQSRDVNFLDFELVNSPNSHIVVIRSNIDGQLMVRDLEYWSESLLYSALKVLVPLTRFWSDDLASDFVYTSGHIPEVFGERVGIERATNYIKELRQSGKLVTIVGHGVNGGYARVLASLTDSEAVTFNAPGYRWMGRRIGADNNIHREVTIVSENDAFNSIDRQSGGQQTIPCDETLVDCHKISHTICSLSASCGDSRTVDTC